MSIFVALGVNVGNFGAFAQPRRPTREWIPEINASLAQLLRARVIGSYGHTGNFVVSSDACSLDSLTRALTGALGTHCAVVHRDDFCAFVHQIREMKSPCPESGIRWTAGGVFLVSGSPGRRTVTSTNRAKLCRMAHGFVAAWKRDHLDSFGRLDCSRRAGGWGRVATDVAAQVGGIWTARSINTMEGLLKRADNAA